MRGCPETLAVLASKLPFQGRGANVSEGWKGDLAQPLAPGRHPKPLTKTVTGRRCHPKSRGGTGRVDSRATLMEMDTCLCQFGSSTGTLVRVASTRQQTLAVHGLTF